jgi:hypothetical protein
MEKCDGEWPFADAPLECWGLSKGEPEYGSDVEYALVLVAEARVGAIGPRDATRVGAEAGDGT